MIVAASTAVLGLALLSVVTLPYTSAKKQCDVTVLIESHCGDTRRFIQNELVPIWPKVDTRCNLELVPFGKAQSTKTGFTCQHGEKECKGNMVMSCAYQKLSPGQKQLDFTSCFMADPDNNGQKCAASCGIQWSDIERCMQSGEGTRLQKIAERKSVSIKTSNYVPTIIINKTYNQQNQNDAESGRFKALMCRYTNSADICA